MYGSNLSTVFADSPPPLEEDADDHGEFVFSAENNAIGEAVLNKIEGKLQRNAETRDKLDVENFADFNGGEGGIQSEKFVAFADFDTSHTDNISEVCSGESNEKGNKSDRLLSSEMNGTSEKKELNHRISESEENSGDDFGDFSSDWSDFSGNSNHASKNVVNGHEENEPGFNSISSFDNDVSFGDFSKLDGEPKFGNKIALPKDGEKRYGEQEELPKSDEIKPETENSSRDSEFGDFSDHHSEDNDIGGFQGPSNVSNSDQDLNVVKDEEEKSLEQNIFVKPDKSKQEESSTCDVKEDNFASFEAFNGDHNFANFQGGGGDNDFGDFSERIVISEKGGSISGKPDKSIPSKENKCDIGPRTNTDENQSAGVQSLSNYNKSKNLTEVDKQDFSAVPSTEDDFGDFADFSENSFNAFSQSTTTDVAQKSESNFGSFSQHSSSDTTQQAQTDFGVFSKNSNSNTTQVPQADFGAFSNKFDFNITQQPQTEVGSSSQSSLSFPNTTTALQNSKQSGFSLRDKRISKVQSSKSTSLVSLQRSFPRTFTTLQYHVELLRDLKMNGGIRISRGHLWTSLCSNSSEGALRFSWDKCKTSDTICKTLNVTKDKILAQPSVLAMTEGLEVPVFATGLGILQPSVVPTPPKKKKSKSKQPKEILNRTILDSSASGGFMSVQQSGLVITESKTESGKDNGSDTASDTASLDLEFFASAPSNVPMSTDQGSNNSLYNLDFALGVTPLDSQHGSQFGLINHQNELENFAKAKPFQGDPLKIFKKLDTTKMSSTVVTETKAQLTPRAMEIIGNFDDLSFMHSSVLMFPLHKID